MLTQAARLRESLGISSCFAVPVVHCAHAYGLVVETAAGWKLCYSGDCRPSPKLAEAARGCAVLVHEATFSDAYADDARQKRHSTISEAIAVGADAGACRVVLTHFSQRYPALPDGLEGQTHVVVASDLMRATFAQLAWAPALVPALKLLYGDEEEGEDAAALLGASLA